MRAVQAMHGMNGAGGNGVVAGVRARDSRGNGVHVDGVVQARNGRGNGIVQKRILVGTLFEASRITRVPKAFRDRPTVKDVADVLELTEQTVRHELEDGVFRRALLDGREFVLKGTKTGAHKAAPFVFDRAEFEAFRVAVEEERARFIALPEMPAVLRKRGVRVTDDNLHQMFRSAENGDDGSLVLNAEVDGVMRRMELRLSKNPRLNHSVRFMSRGEFRFFARYVKAQRQRLREREKAPEGFVWLADAARLLGVHKTTLISKVKNRRGKRASVRARKIQGKHAISVKQFERLKKEFEGKKHSRESRVLLRDMLKGKIFEGLDLNEHIERRGERRFFFYSDERGARQEVEVHFDSRKAYRVSPEDAAKLKAFAALFEERGVYCRTKLFAEVAGFSFHTVRRIRGGALSVCASRGKPFNFETVRVRKWRFVKRLDLLAFFHARDGCQPLPADANLKRVVLCGATVGDEFAIGIPRLKEEEFTARELGLASFYRRLFFASEQAAVKAILDFFKRLDGEQDDFTLAKLRLARHYYCVTRLTAASNHLLGNAFEREKITRLFEVEPRNDSGIFFVPKPNGGFERAAGFAFANPGVGFNFPS